MHYLTSHTITVAVVTVKIHINSARTSWILY